MKKNLTGKFWYQTPEFRKILRIMKVTTLLLLISFSSLTAGVYSQSKTFSLKLENASVESIIQKITEQSKFNFVYSNDDLNNLKAVDINITEANIEEILNICLQDTDLGYQILDEVIIISPRDESELNFKPEETIAIEIKGKVTDNEGTPLPGATILEQGTLNGVTTDANGDFTLTVTSNTSKIKVSFIGFTTQIIEVGDKTAINVILEESAESLKEVLITGYQTLSKERSTGSFSQPDVQVIQNRAVGGNVLQSLEGLVPGLAVNQSPNSSHNSLLIRGLTTIGIVNSSGTYSGGGTNRNPLYVVDGIPIDDVSTIDAQDVESINVLKDATASSIWGSRAANGVIVITTKNGKKKDKLQIEYDGYFNFKGYPDLDFQTMLTSSQFIDAARSAFDPTLRPFDQETAYTNLGSYPVPFHDLVMYGYYGDNINYKLDSLASIDNSNQIKDFMYRQASTMNHSLSMKGGGDIYNFYSSIGFTNNIDNTPGNKANTYRINLRQNIKLHKNIKFSLITQLTRRFNESARKPDGFDYTLVPYQLLQGLDGNNLSIPWHQNLILSEPVRDEFSSLSGVNLDFIPLDDYYEGYTKTKSLNVRITAGLEIKLLKGLTFEGTYGYNSTFSKRTSFDSENAYSTRIELVQFTEAPASPGGSPVYHLPSTGGKRSIRNSNTTNWTIRNQMTFDKNWNDKHQLTLLVGQEASERLTKYNNAMVRGFNTELFTYPLINNKELYSGISGTIMTNYGSRSRITNPNEAYLENETLTRFTSYYANVAYTFNKKYSINASWRIDGSNLFGKDKAAQNKPIWSVGTKWLMHKEDFMKHISWIDRLSVRATYGLTGNAPLPGLAASEDLITAYSHPWVYGGMVNMIQTPANRKLTWESTSTINFGFDFFIFKKLSGSVDVYSKKTSNMLGNIETNSFTGYSTVLGNLGTMTNKGIEFTLQAPVINKKDFSWTSRLILSYNKNMITSFNFTSAASTGAQLVSRQFEEGFPAFAVFAYDNAGLDEMGDPQIQLADGTITKDKNVATPEDILLMGTYQPKWSGGFSNTFSYKNFTLSANMVINLGHVMRINNSINATKFSGVWNQNVSALYLESWKTPGDENNTDIPVYLSNESTSSARRDLNYWRYGDNNVVSASFIKLRDMTLAYRLPKSMLQKANLNEVTLRLTLNNVMLWKENDAGIDPEFQGALPYGRNSLTLGIHVSL